MELTFFILGLILVLSLIVYSLIKIDKDDPLRIVWILIIFSVPVLGSLIALAISGNKSYRGTIVNKSYTKRG